MSRTFVEVLSAIAVIQKKGLWVTPDRMSSLRTLAESVSNLPGVFAEFGVAHGASALLLGWIAQQQNRRICLFDNFAGLPEPGPEDGPQATASVGHCKGDLAQVVKQMKWLGVDFDIKPGDFSQTVHFPYEEVALLHLDCDWYASTKIVLEQVGPKVVSGGVIVCDDYGYWPGARQAVDEWLEKRDDVRLCDGPAPQVYWSVP